MNLSKIVIIFFSFLINCSPIFAQDGGKVNEQIEELFNQAHLFHQKQENGKAIETYTKIIELDRNNADAYWDRAFIYSDLQQYESAISDCRTINILNPNFAQAFGSLGWYLILLGQIEEAKAPLMRAHEMEPHVYAWPVNLGHVLLLSGEEVAARRYYETALNLLNSEEDFENGPIADFKLFINKGWNAKACLREMLWMQNAFHSEPVTNKPELVIQKGHLATIHSISFSPDGKYIITASEDGTAKLWEVSTGRAIRTFENVGTNASYSPSGKHIATSSADYVELWNVSTGRIRRTFRGHSDYINSLSFSPDGQYLATGSSDKTAKLWDIKTGEAVYTFTGHDWQVKFIAFSPDGKYLATADANTIRLWSLRTGKLHRIFDWKPPFSISRGNIIFTPDGKYVVSTNDKLSIKFRDIVTGHVRIFHDESVGREACISQDGKYLFTAGGMMPGELWDISERTLIVALDSSSESISSAAFGPNNKYLATGNGHGEMHLWDLKTMQKVRIFKCGETSVRPVRFTTNGKALLMGHKDNTVKLWELSTFQPIRSIRGILSRSGMYGKYVISMSVNDTATIWNAETGMRIQTFNLDSSSCSPTALSSDGRYMAMECFDQNKIDVQSDMGLIERSWENTATIWNTNTNKKIRTLRWSTKYALNVWLDWGGRYSERIKFSPDNNYVVTGYPSHYAVLWDVKTGKELITFRAHGDEINEVDFSPDGKRIATASTDRTAKIWDVATGKEIHTLSAHLRSVWSVTFSLDGKYIATGSGDGTAKLWDAKEGLLIRSFVGHVGDVSSVNFSPNSKYLVTRGADATIKLWEVHTGNELVTFIYLDEDNWVLATADNYYTTSRAGQKDIWFRVGMQAFPFEQFDLRLNRPDIVLQRIGVAPQELIDSYYRAYQKRLKKMDFTEDMLGEDFHVPVITLVTENLPISTSDKMLTFKIRALDSKYLLDRLNVFVNDVPTFGTSGINLRDKQIDSTESDISLELSNGNNKIQVSVLNENGSESLKETFEVFHRGPQKKPDLYLVTIGVSKYQDTLFNLQYAVSDVKDLASGFADNKNVYNNIFIREILNERAIRENIHELRGFLDSSQVDDVVIVFVAGHGVLDDTLDFYFGTYDMDFNNPKERGLSYDELESLMENIPARRKLLLMDACHGGELDKEDVELAVLEHTEYGKVTFRSSGEGVRRKKGVGLDNAFQLSRSLFSDLRRRTGATVIAAAGGGEYALEGEKWRNGVFTFCVLSGLEDKRADKNKDSIITVSELQQYVEIEVLRLTDRRQRPVFRSENLANDFRIW